MKKFIIYLSLFLMSCAPAPKDGKDGESCSVSQSVDGSAVITCTDGSSAVVNSGQDGEDGSDGENGQDGTSCAVEQNDDSTSTVSCDDGTYAVVANGANGQNGADGVDGEDGVDAYADHLAFVVELSTFRESVVDLHAHDASNNGLSRCTGSKTTDGKVITAAHCLGSNVAKFYIFTGPEHIEVGTVDAENFEYYLVANRDLIILTNVSWSVKGEGLPGINPAFNYTPEVGEVIGLLSHPLNLHNDLQTTIGYVSDEEYTGTSFGVFWSESFLADLVAASGSSGAPVFTRDGEWVGLLVGGFVPSSGLDLSIVLPFR